MKLQGYSNIYLLISFFCIIAAVNAKNIQNALTLNNTSNDTSLSEDLNVITREEIKKEFCAILECVKKTKVLGNFVMLINELDKVLIILLPHNFEMEYKNGLNLTYDAIISTLIQVGKYIEIISQLLKPIYELHSIFPSLKISNQYEYDKSFRK